MIGLACLSRKCSIAGKWSNRSNSLAFLFVQTLKAADAALAGALQKNLTSHAARAHRVLMKHAEDHGVHLSWKKSHDGQRRHVKGDAAA